MLLQQTLLQKFIQLINNYYEKRTAEKYASAQSACIPMTHIIFSVHIHHSELFRWQRLVH